MKREVQLILDSCVLINLAASGVIENILSVIARKSMVCVLVKNESLFLRSEDDISETIPIDIGDLIVRKLVHLCDCDTAAEQESFVNFASLLDDGEAMSLALALSRDWDFATDDKKARRIFSDAENHAQLVSTSDLIKQWAAHEGLDDSQIKPILVRIERRANFRPSKSDPNLQWWTDVIAT